MDPNILRDHLNQLHRELGEVQGVDPAAHPALGDLMQDLKRLMDAPPQVPAPAGAVPTPGTAVGGAGVTAHQPLPERLEKIAVLFEADHPTLAASSRRLVDLLGKMGV